MRQVTATEKYNAVLEGKMAKREFVRQMRQTFPQLVSQYDGFDSTVQILKNRSMIFEAQKPAFSGVKVYDDRPALTYSLDALDRGVRAELAVLGLDPAVDFVDKENLDKATNKAKDNLEKDANHYLNLMAGESNKVDKHDKEKEVKRGAADKDTFNDMKKATLKEGVDDRDDDELSPEELANKHAGSPMHQPPGLEERLKEALSNPTLLQAVKQIKTMHPEVTSGIIDDFIDMHGQDILDGADPMDEFHNYIDANYETAADFRDVDEKKGKDHDGDGDIDSDDYMMAKDKAIKKAMGKDEMKHPSHRSAKNQYAQRARVAKPSEEEKERRAKEHQAFLKRLADKDKEIAARKQTQLKEAIKSIIKKTLLNEAATVKLADWAESYETFPGVKPVVNELENIVTEIETFYDKMSDKIKNVFEKTADFENEEGLKIGGFIAPGLESAFRQDLSKVIKKGSFFSKINLPKVRTITQADIDAHNSGERPLGETDVTEEPKSTVFTPNF